MAIQIKNDNVLINHINDLQSSINSLDSRMTTAESKFAQYLPLTGGGLTGPLTSSSSITASGGFIGNATSASLLSNYGGRIASPSNMIADGKMRLYLSTSSMTTDKPPTSDGHILHFAWDNKGGYDNELAIANNGTGTTGAHLAVRGGAGSGSGNTQSWSNWYTVLDTGNYSSKVPRSYGFVKFATSGAISVASSGTTISKTISLTTHGRPVFLAVSGDNNPTDSTSWFNIYFYRGGTQLSHQIDESHGSSWNIPFCMVYLDIVAAGTYTYECRITSGSGATNLNEDSARQSPNFVAFEI